MGKVGSPGGQDPFDSRTCTLVASRCCAKERGAPPALPTAPQYGKGQGRGQLKENALDEHQECAQHPNKDLRRGK